MKLIHEKIFAKLSAIIDLNELKEKECLKFASSGLMDLNVNYLGDDGNGNTIISLSHNYLQNGDLMTDPEMHVRILPKIQMAEALTFQQDSAPRPTYQQVYTNQDGQIHMNRALKKNLNVFLLQWLKNIQHHYYTKEVIT